MSDRIQLDDWRAPRKPKSKWRRRAREAILEVVNEYSPYYGSNPRVVDVPAMLKAIDAAYPFGERAMHPYTAWLEERKLIRAAIVGDRPAPTADDLAACEVALDLVELGRLDEARALLEEQAPNRLNVQCVACGQHPGSVCHDAESVAFDAVRWIPRVVPHLVRVQPAALGPLFGEP